MIRLSQARSKTLLAIHGWSAVALGLLLYAVIVTGTLAVFEDAIGVWADPMPVAPVEEIPNGTGALMADIAARIDPAYLDEVFLFSGTGEHLRALFHYHGDDGTEPAMLFLIDPAQQRVVREVEGLSPNVFRQLGVGALRDFLVDLHVNLLLPGRWGLLATGVLGFAMLVAAVSGLLIHRHLLKELFTLRRKGGLLTARDRHALAGSWNLPFAFLLSFTGAFFSFGGAIGLPAIAYVAFGGDVETVSEELLAPIMAEDDRPSPLADIDAMIQDAARRTGAEPSSLQIHHWGRADASLLVGLNNRDGELLPSAVAYAGASGEFLGLRPALGNAPSLGGDLVSLMSPLHFGNFAGIASKILWFAMGFASAYVALTGLMLWTRRRQAEPGWRWLEKLTVIVGYGLPLALLINAAVYVTRRPVPSAAFYDLLSVFLAAMALTAFYGFAQRDAARSRRGILRAMALVMLALPAARYWGGGLGWQAAISGGLPAVLTIDGLLLVSGAWLLWTQRRAPAPAMLETESEPEALKS